MAKTKEALYLDYHSQIQACNDILSGKKKDKNLEDALADLTGTETELKKIIQGEVFDSLPCVRDAIERFDFEVPSHKRNSENGKTTSIEATKKKVQIDMVAFCERKGLPLDWYHELQSLNKRLTLRLAKSLGMSATEVKSIDDSYLMSEIAKQIELGKNPVSNTQCVNHMQKVLDLLCEGIGKVNNYDLAYIMAAYSKRSNKSKLTIVASKHNQLVSLVTDVAHKIAMGYAYNLDCKRDATSVTKVAEKAAEREAEKAAEVAQAEAEKAA